MQTLLCLNKAISSSNGFFVCQPNSSLQGCVAMPYQDPLVQEWASYLAELNIESTLMDHIGDYQSRRNNIQSSEGILTSMSRMNKVLIYMANNLKVIHTMNVQEAAKKTPGWGKFDDAKKSCFSALHLATTEIGTPRQSATYSIS